MAGWRRATELMKTRLTRVVSWLRPVRPQTLISAGPTLACQQISEDVPVASGPPARRSPAEESRLWYANGFQANVTAAKGIRLARLPLAKGLLNLVDILSKNASQSDPI